MELYGVRAASWPQKIWIIACELGLLAISYPILFGAWGTTFARRMGWREVGALERRVIVFVFSVVVFVRMTYMMLRLLKRRIPVDEAFTIPLAFATYYVGFPLLTLRTARPLGSAAAAAGIGLFVVGSLLNSVSEIQRARWKARPGNAGRLYTRGLFSWSMHINYFGDVLWVAGYALVSGNPWAALVPVSLFCFFAFFNAPKLDAYLRRRYGAEFEAYVRTTAKLVPRVY